MTKISVLAKRFNVTTAAIYKRLQDTDIAPHVIETENGRKALNDEGVTLLTTYYQQFATRLQPVDNELTTENERLKNQLFELQAELNQALRDSLEQANKDKERYAELLAIIANSKQPLALPGEVDEAKEKKNGFFSNLFKRS
jgi:hypothetical protein